MEKPGEPTNHIATRALKGMNLKGPGQAEPRRRVSLIFADSRLFLENKAFVKRGISPENSRSSQETADFCRNLQQTADWRLFLGFVPLSAALPFPSKIQKRPFVHNVLGESARNLG